MRHRSGPAWFALSLSLACNGGGGGDDEVASASSTTGESSGTTQEGEESASSEASSSSESSGSTDAESTDSSSSTDAESSTTDAESTESTTESTTDSTSESTTETTGEPLPPSDIEVIITADNAYGFGYGTVDEIVNYYGGIENTTAGQIFNCGEGPELYEIPGDVADMATHLYIVAWADSAVTQGVLGRFRKLEMGGGGGFGDFVLTGDEGWEVCATGIDYQPGSGGPPLMQVNQLIGSCNLDDLSPQTTSVGWVDEIGTQFGAVAVGEDNTTPYNGGPMPGNEYPLVCPMDMPADARWMWFNWDPANIVWPQQSPFLWPGGGGNPDHQFLIFRLAADLLPEPQ